jgi:hypothetical protein
MVVIDVGNDVKERLGLYMDGYLHKNLSEIKESVLKKDFDYVAIISGRVGKGKSTLSQQLAKFFDKTFDTSRVCFSAEEFIQVTSTCPKHSAVILDESFEPLNTKISLSPAFLKIQNHLNIIRQRNLFIILVLPSFFDLHKSVALYRSWNLFHVYGEGFAGRGRFVAFSPDSKRMLYIRGGKYNDYNAWKGNFHGKFTAKQVIDWKEYEKKKLTHLKSQGDNLGKGRVRDIQKVKLVTHLIDNKVFKTSELSKIMGVSPQSITSIMRKSRERVLK